MGKGPMLALDECVSNVNLYENEICANSLRLLGIECVCRVYLFAYARKFTNGTSACLLCWESTVVRLFARELCQVGRVCSCVLSEQPSCQENPNDLPNETDWRPQIDPGPDLYLNHYILLCLDCQSNFVIDFFLLIVN